MLSDDAVVREQARTCNDGYRMNGTWFAQTIRVSGRVRRANRPDTDLLLTSAKSNF